MAGEHSHGAVEELERGSAATGSRLGSALLIAHALGVPFEKLLVYLWRRHLLPPSDADASPPADARVSASSSRCRSA